ncbi:MAG: ABC transporter ATP-binding protein [Candidatus Merdivicinus sp.]|jgi:ATP-binding cassette subfamily B multidrug efflux pump
MNMLMRYIRPYLLKMSGGMFIKFIGAIMDLLLPWFLAYIIDNIIPLKSVPQIFLWGGVMLVCSILAWVTNIIANRIAGWVSKCVVGNMRHDLFQKISTLSCSQVDGFSIPSLISRVTSDSYNIHSMVGMVQRMGIRAPILLLGGIIVTLTLEPALALVLIAMMPPLAIIIVYVSRKGIPLYANLQKGIDRMVQVVRENIIGIRVIKALSKTDYEKGRFEEINQEVVRREKKAGLTMAVTNPSMNLFLNIGLTLVILVGAFRVNAGISQAGKIIAFMSYFTIILNALLSINRIFVICSKGIASANRIREVLDTIPDLEVQFNSQKKNEEAHISFRNVCFSYSQTERTLTDINFSLKKGETLGIIGATGAGKTAVINLLMRLYEANSGEIRINGVNVNAIPPEELHTKFGIVFQHDVLFADTVAENISFGRDIPPERLEEAARDAQALEFINELPGRFDYELAIKGSNLSGGQKQRLLIARALAGKPEILVLDDSSSALDYKTDAQLRQAIREHYAGTTTIIIAQRISSILHADHILVLEDGREIGYGTHEELMEECESYREISESQMGGGNIG